MRLLLLRHGATPGNLKKQYIGSTDQPLAQEGIDQAIARAKSLPPVERVWCSSMLRAKQTADLFFPDAPKEYLDGLREMDFGTCEGKTWEEINDPSIYDDWLRGIPEACFPGGETLGAFMTRILASMKNIAQEAQQEQITTGALVAHGGVLMALMAACGRPKRDYFDWESENCGGFDTEFDPATGEITFLARIGKGKLW
jgi:alpha-ribazole phosphatase